MGIVGNSPSKFLKLFLNLGKAALNLSNRFFQRLALSNQAATGISIQLAFHFLGILVSLGAEFLNLL